MNPLDRFRNWLARRPREHPNTPASGTSLREFVYLDEVSVFSLVASRRGSIATEFTSAAVETLDDEIEATLSGSAGFAKAEVRGREARSSEKSSQVVRKSVVQGTFNELFNLERDHLVLTTESRDHARPSVGAAQLVSVPADGYWIVDVTSLQRGALVEIDVILEADPVFRVNAIVSTFLEIVQEDLAFFGIDPSSGFNDIGSTHRFLDRLLSGLIPLRGHVVDYSLVEILDRQLLVRKELIDSIQGIDSVLIRPLVVVGVAERRSFWKDIRRVLFDGSRYRLYCRIAQTGVQASWSPVKLLGVLREVAPELESQVVGAVGETALIGMGSAVAAHSTRPSGKEQLIAAATVFAGLALRHHRKRLNRKAVDRLAESAASRGGSLETVEQRRAFFRHLLDDIDAELGVKTTRDVAVDLRDQAWTRAATAGPLRYETRTREPDRFLDTEIVAIYW